MVGSAFWHERFATPRVLESQAFCWEALLDAPSSVR